MSGRRRSAAAIAGAAFVPVLARWGAGAGASRAPGLDRDELGCQQTAARVVARFYRDKLKCLGRCATARHHGRVEDCRPSAIVHNLPGKLRARRP
jgi:hypothetical protein